MILCFGLTPALQRTMRFSELVVGEVNRASTVVTTASGKAVNVARIVATVGGKSHLVQPLGGDSGRQIERLLTLDGVAQTNIWSPTDQPTRTCTTLLAESTTELVEEAQALSEAELSELLTAVKQQAKDATALCLSGSLPPGVDTVIYANLIATTGLPTVLDAQREPLRRALMKNPYLVKPNRSETIAALSLPQETDALGCANALRERGARNALVSEGTAGAVLSTEAGAWRVLPPKVDAMNPIGAGDSLTGGLAFAHFERGDSLLEAVCFGTACAAANCLTLTSGVIVLEEVERLRPEVRVERLG